MVRQKNLVSQHIEVALVYRDMLGLDEAVEYLARECVPREIVERVLLTERRRAPGSFAPMAPAACRRRNHVQHAIVEAALKIEHKLGREAALALMREEKVPSAVAERVLAREPGRLRVRQT